MSTNPTPPLLRLLASLRRWWRDRNRTSWVWCPECRRDLNGDNHSWVCDIDATVFYRCADCGFRSEFLFDTPAPVFLGTWEVAS